MRNGTRCLGEGEIGTEENTDASKKWCLLIDKGRGRGSMDEKNLSGCGWTGGGWCIVMVGTCYAEQLVVRCWERWIIVWMRERLGKVYKEQGCDIKIYLEKGCRQRSGMVQCCFYNCKKHKVNLVASVNKDKIELHEINFFVNPWRGTTALTTKT